MPNDWSFYDVVVGIIALLFTLIGGGWALYERSKNKKDLRYLPSESTSLIVDRSDIGQLTVLYNDVKVKDPQITTIECSNNERFPITPDDFIEPITISGDSKVLSAVVAKVNPEGLKPSVNFTQNQVIIQPLLLNGSDSFSINLLTDGKYGNLKMSARIAGVKEIKRIRKVSQLTLMIMYVFAGIVISTLANVIVEFFISR
jgi:hypothetical protein